MIRSAVPDDAAALVALRALVYPYLVRGTASTRRTIIEPPPGEHWAGFVAEIDGRLIGWAGARQNVTTSEAGVGEISLLHVHPDHRRYGVGSALLTASLQHLRRIGGIRRVRTWAQPASLDFARQHGFEPSRQVRYSVLDLRQSGPAALLGDDRIPEPDDVRLVPLSEVDARSLYEVDSAATADEPGDLPQGETSYPTWKYDVWDDVGLDKKVSTAAIIGSAVVAFSLAQRDGNRIWSDMTATVPQHRGRGLARLVKSETLRRAAAEGATVAYTANDESNAPMLAVNRRLGYRPMASQLSCLTTLP